MSDENQVADEVYIYIDGEKVAVCESFSIDRVQDRVTDLGTGEIEQRGIINIVAESKPDE